MVKSCLKVRNSKATLRIYNNNFGRTYDVAGVIIGRDGEELNDERVVQRELRAFGEVVVAEYVLEFALGGAVEVGYLRRQRVGAYRILGGYRHQVKTRAHGKEVPIAQCTPAVLEFEHEGDGIAGGDGI